VKVPAKWIKLSWASSTLGFWFTELLERDTQFKTWCFKARPKVFWMTGFFNPQVAFMDLGELKLLPQGFLTAMKQEVTRSHKGWALDNVVTQNLITRFSKEDIDKPPPEGVYIHGLFLEGASLDKKTGKLVESRAKTLYEQMPVIYIYAINTTGGKDSKLYEAPMYRKPARKEVTLSLSRSGQFSCFYFRSTSLVQSTLRVMSLRSTGPCEGLPFSVI
jgi:dynein heavy chain